MTPLPSMPAPDFTVDVLNPDYSFGSVSLKDYAGKYLVILFYPADFTFVCPSEIHKFNDNLERFRAAGAEVLIGSTDGPFVHLAWTQTPRAEGGLGKMAVPLFADRNLKFSRDYGVLIEDAGLSLRGMFIISDKGILRHVTVNDFQVGRNVEEALRLVQGFKHADETGAGIPCDWTPGSDTIIQDPEGKKEFFLEHQK
ncbi:peroxiredoxin, AhpC-type [Kipferlia bialata]|uniref:Peroxiredoxin, AhpC-type n=1 Tax=Kipferlia bialata TaxID=797122 RepID=A0A391NK67_9EUKA|nr:peroxiredoxin, AhpC-type [Kipferlia bialata]|eukprot:g3752.t1